MPFKDPKKHINSKFTINMQINKIKWKTSVVLHALYESSHCLLPHMQILYLYENKRGVHLLITQYARYASEKQAISSSATYFSMPSDFQLEWSTSEEIRVKWTGFYIKEIAWLTTIHMRNVMWVSQKFPWSDSSSYLSFFSHEFCKGLNLLVTLAKDNKIM